MLLLCPQPQGEAPEKLAGREHSRGEGGVLSRTAQRKAAALVRGDPGAPEWGWLNTSHVLEKELRTDLRQQGVPRPLT